MKDHTQGEVTQWMTTIIRGLLLRQPEKIQIRQHKKNLFIRVHFEQLPEEELDPFSEMVLKNCSYLRFTPKTTVHFADFEGQWPPFKLMKELDRPKLILVGNGGVTS